MFESVRRFRIGGNSGNCRGNGDPRPIQAGCGVSPPLLPGNLAQRRASSVLPARRRFLYKIIGKDGKTRAATRADRSGTLMNRGTATADYIMEDPREAMRLEVKVDPDAWVQKYLAHRVRPSAEVLSVGCGPGVILRAVANLDPSIRATGVDISSHRLRQAAEKNREHPRVQFVCGDAQSLEFQSNSFDLVYCRMLLQYLKEKERAVCEMARVCKPGGTVLLQDLDGQLLWHYSENPAVQRTLEKVVTALAI